MRNTSQRNLLHYIKGYLTLELKGDYIERFLNMCRAHDISLWNINCDEKKCSYFCDVCCKDFKEILPFLKKTGTRIHVNEKKGIPFKLRIVRKKIIFLICVLLFLISLELLTNYVWAIEFVGNRKITNDELMDFLVEENIHYGMKKEEFDCELEEKRLRAKFYEVTWTSIYFEGTKLFIEIEENENHQSQTQKSDLGSNIVASCDGIIYSIVTRNGVPKVKIGDEVKQGQVLVEGNVPIYDEGKNIIDYQTYDADADILIQTSISYKDSISNMHPVISYSGRKRHTFFIEIPGYLFESLFKGDYSMSEKISAKYQLKLLDNIYLPIFYGNIMRKEYHLDYIEYTKEEMESILTNNFDEFILCLQEKGVQILEKNVKISRNSNKMELNSDILLINKSIKKEKIYNINRED